MDLSKLSHCIPHDLPITDAHAYRCGFDTGNFLHSHSLNTGQNKKINNICSIFTVLLHGFSQDSILGGILFSIDLFLQLIKLELKNFIDNIKISRANDCFNECNELTRGTGICY